MKQHESHRTSFLASIAFALPIAQAPSVLPRGESSAEVSASVGRIWGDTDGDSLLDLYLVNPAGEDRLFRNRGDGSFEDVTVRTGLAGRSGTLTADWKDFDGDTKLDLLLVTRNGEILVFRGESPGTFRESSVELGIVQTGVVKSAEWLDYDADGSIDLSVVADGHGPLFFHGVKGRAFERVELALPVASPAALASGDFQATAGADTELPLRETGGKPADVASTGRLGGMGPRPSGSNVGPALTLPGYASATPGGTHAPATAALRGSTPPDPDPNPTCVLDQASSSCITVSTVPQFGSLYPLGNEFSIDPSGHVTIGISGSAPFELGPAPAERRLYVRTAVASGLAIFGESTSTIGATEGIRGQSASPAGRGMIGRASASTGSTEGVRGESVSPAGRGVSGEAPAEGIRGAATATSGVARGIFGTTASSEGEGVLGEVTAASGVNVGVRGTSASPTGRGVGGRAPSEGVRGEATATAGIARGIFGTTTSSEGEGVLGEVTAASGDNVGVRGTSSSPTGRGVGGRAPSEGVRGEATATAGIARGIFGTTTSSEGEGVLGEVTAASGDNVGVRGTSSSPTGRGVGGRAPSEGVRGEATARTGIARGIFGTTTSSEGEGVLGEVTATSGDNVGVRGTSTSPTGRGVGGRAPSEGVRGEATATTGVARGIFGTTTSSEGEGVRGEVTAASGDNVGVRGMSASPTGRGVGGRAPREGVLGEATETVGIARGVRGTSASLSGEGVLGEATFAMGNNVGVRGTSASISGLGVEGSAPSVGVLGNATGTGPAGGGGGVGGAVGVRGTAAALTGCGVEGSAPSEGVRGIASGPMTFGVGVRGSAVSELGFGVLGLLHVSGAPVPTFGAGVRGHTSDTPGSSVAYGVCGSSDAQDAKSAGVLAIGKGTDGIGPLAAALEISNGAIVVSGNERPAGSFFPWGEPGASWAPIKSCIIGGPPHQHTIGHFIDRELQNDLIVADSIILVTMDSDGSPTVGTTYSAQVFAVHPGGVVVRVSVVGDSETCMPPSSAFSAQLRLNYLIINPTP